MPPSAEELRLTVARLRLRAPSVHSILITSPRLLPPVTEIGRGLARAAAESGLATRLIEVSEHADNQERSIPERKEVAFEITSLRPNDAFDSAHVSALLSGSDLVIATADGLLERAEALLLAAAADATVLVARRAGTARDDLVKSRSEVVRCGNQILGAIYLQ